LQAIGLFDVHPLTEPFSLRILQMTKQGRKCPGARARITRYQEDTDVHSKIRVQRFFG
jgi:hypothetical protein